MKVYVVIERQLKTDIDPMDDRIFGIFSNEGKAKEIKDTLLKNFEEWNEMDDHTVEIKEIKLDTLTEDYHWYMTYT